MSIQGHKHTLRQAVAESRLILDGAMGTMIQTLGLSEEDFRGETFADHAINLSGCNDVLCLSRPDAIRDIHIRYIEAGTDIISTNTFNANAISLAEYGLEAHVADINRAGVAAAKEAALSAGSDRHVFVAGSIGPTNKSLSIASGISFDELHDAYLQQASALIDAGADALLIETIFDTLNAKAAIAAAMDAMLACGKEVPLMLSVTLTETGRTLSGQTLEAFVASVSHCNPLTIGLNCGFGPLQLSAYLKRLSAFGIPLSFHPNAGLPDAYGNYTLSPDLFATEVADSIAHTNVRIAGGCCGTTPSHISALADKIRNLPCDPLTKTIPQDELLLSGLEPMPIYPNGHELTRVGERCNVAGSRKFLRLIKENNTDEAVEIARSQVLAGANILDINLDDGMLDAPAEMARFLDAIAADPVAAAVPVMIDSSSQQVIREGLKHVQGKCIVNSISLKDGEERMLNDARHIHSMGAAVVVMAMDETGQADTCARKLEIARRAYRLLTEKAGFRPNDIIFDPNVLTIATGIADHANYAVEFIEAARAIKSEMPLVHVSGGISNLSFAFRGIETVRKAMHAEFISAADALDMAIVNPSASLKPDDYPEELRIAVRDVILNTDTQATDRLTALALKIKSATENKTKAKVSTQEARTTGNISDELAEKIIHGTTSGIRDLIISRIEAGERPLDIVEKSLMKGIGVVGDDFGAGRIFLPQVVRSADAMQHAVDILAPFISASQTSDTEVNHSPKVILATVKGDVHDIGKNIVAILLRCNGFDVVDLGTKQPADIIIQKAIESNADMVALSGLITPSLQEMVNVAAAMQQCRLRIPLFVGGAATSAESAAVRIAPVYEGPVFHTREAAALQPLAKKWLDPQTRASVTISLKASQDNLRYRHSTGGAVLLTLEQARANAPKPYTEADKSTESIPKGTTDFHIRIDEAAKLINWRQFMTVWQIDASMASVADIDGCDHCRALWLANMPEEKRKKAAEAMQLHKEAMRLIHSWNEKYKTLSARIATLDARRDGDDIIALTDGGVQLKFPTLRSQRSESGKPSVAIADFIAAPPATDRITLFAVTVGKAIRDEIDNCPNEYSRLLSQALADRLAEAATEWLHRKVNGGLGIRPAIGYQSLPDQSLIFVADNALHYDEIGIELTENGAMYPQASTTGMIIHRPDAEYFTVGTIGADQFEDYCHRRGIPEARMQAFLKRGKE